jgi:predicted TIM-barrel fold metal-dependent hydrolase
MTTEIEIDAPLIVRQDWLDKVAEDIVDPDRRIVDPHHHFFAESEHFPHYDLDDLWADTGSHNVEQTVYLQCWEGHRKSGPEELMPVGETEWVHGIAAEARKRPDAAQIGAMMGTAELRLGAAARAVLEAHQAASPLFRGIRQIAAWDAADELMSMPDLDDGNLYGDPKFREGFALLDEMGLVFDAYHYHTQTPFLTDLARAFPGVDIVLNHLGTPPGIGPYAGRREEIFGEWTAGLKDLATCPNVTVKLGGLAMPWTGFGFEDRPTPPTSDDIVREQAHYYHYAIETFGPDRCMFESNFPVDKVAVSYPVIWNAFKKMVADFTEDEKDQMFRGTATRVYGLGE